MSLRSTIVGALLLGDQYGLQLHGEIVSRTARRQALNVGQIYSTLDRLVGAELVRTAGVTGDGLTLYGLTDAGRTAATRWVATPSTPLGWDDMREQVLLVSTLPGHDCAALIDAYREAWRDRPHTTDDLGADAALSATVDSWLAGLRFDGRQRPLARVRPRRGRRPAA